MEDYIADIALVFHWPLSELEALDLWELTDWRERARIRAEAQPSPKQRTP